MFNKPLLKKRIPTIFGLIILLIGGIGGVYLVGQETNFFPRASVEFAPRQVKISNISDKSLTITWVTDQPASGFVAYGTSASLGSTVQDERDQLSGSSGNFRTHFVTIRGLTPSTTYYFKIGSGPSKGLYDNSGKPYEITTGPEIGTTPVSEVASGTIMTNAQTPAEGAIVFLTLPGSSPASALVRTSGSWAITLSNIRTQDHASYQTITASDVASFEIIGPDGRPTKGALTIQDLDPAPMITLGQDFGTAEPNPTDATTLPPPDPAETPLEPDPIDPGPASDSGRIDPESLSETPTATSSDIVLSTISYDGETINTTKPEFVGISKPREILTITVESDPIYTDTVETDDNGDFAWTPPDDLAPGEHTVTITRADGTKLVRTFVVAAPGDSTLPALTASPSAAAIATPTPSPVSTAPGRISQPSTASGIPVAGNLTPTLTLSILGIGLIFSGILLSRKSY